MLYFIGRITQKLKADTRQASYQNSRFEDIVDASKITLWSDIISTEQKAVGIRVGTDYTVKQIALSYQYAAELLCVSRLYG